VWLSGGDNNIFTQIGFFVLAGLACKNAILKVEFAHEIEQQGRGAVAAAIEAARLRLRPILMTSFGCCAAGAVVRRRRRDASRHGCCFSGMLGVTFFGLFLTPVFYVLLRGVEKRVAKRAAADGIQSDTAAHFLRVNLIDPPLNERTERFRRQRPRPRTWYHVSRSRDPTKSPSPFRSNRNRARSWRTSCQRWPWSRTSVILESIKSHGCFPIRGAGLSRRFPSHGWKD
jgi:AcrB/AcrD/AcrF family